MDCHIEGIYFAHRCYYAPLSNSSELVFNEIVEHEVNGKTMTSCEVIHTDTTDTQIVCLFGFSATKKTECEAKLL